MWRGILVHYPKPDPVIKDELHPVSEVAFASWVNSVRSGHYHWWSILIDSPELFAVYDLSRQRFYILVHEEE